MSWNQSMKIGEAVEYGDTAGVDGGIWRALSAKWAAGALDDFGRIRESRRLPQEVRHTSFDEGEQGN
jgi:hypothetical protein